MKHLTLSPAAQGDVESIWDYTEATWGIDQAEHYTRKLRDACRELAAGRRVPIAVAIRAGYQKIAVESHVVFFREDDVGGIVVVRILHRRMDVNRHL